MLARLGFAGRLILIVLLLVLALGTLGIGLAVVMRESKEFETSRMSIPQQTAAIVALLDSADPSTWPRIARAVATPELTLSFADAPPPITPGAARMPGAEWLISDFLEAKGRAIEVVRRNPAAYGAVRRIFARLSADDHAPVSVAIELANKRFAVFDLSGPTTRRIFGIPYGFWVGAIGFLLSALAVVAIVREARPLRRLSDAVRGFAVSGTPQTVTESGAPEIRGLIGAFNAMQGRIAALLEGRTMLLGAISHDLRTLLTRLRLRIEQIPDAEHREKATREIEDMTAMLDDGLAVARGVAASDRREILDLGELVSDVVSGFDHARVEWSRPPKARSFETEGDPVALRRVVTNLIDNALQHANRCRVSLSRCEQRLELVVDDDGPGIPVEKRAVIFEPFYRLDAARTRSNGSSGLGLAIASTIVQAHRGQISVADSPLGGARFIVTLQAQS
jgi:two-component system, OmpR family, osmolarity sensor histidine kinase EnvZ